MYLLQIELHHFVFVPKFIIRAIAFIINWPYNAISHISYLAISLIFSALFCCLAFHFVLLPLILSAFFTLPPASLLIFCLRVFLPFLSNFYCFFPFCHYVFLTYFLIVSIFLQSPPITFSIASRLAPIALSSHPSLLSTL